MIEAQLAVGFEAQIAAIANQRALANEALESEDNRDDAERLRVRLKYLAKLESQVKEAQLSIFTASSAIEEMEQRFIRWRGIANECRAIEKEIERLEREFPRLAAACLEPEHAVRVASAELSDLRNAPMHEYPTEREKRSRRDELEKLQAVLNDCTSKLRDAARKREYCNGDLMKAKDRLANAQFRERMARLPADPAPFKGVGELSAVR